MTFDGWHKEELKRRFDEFNSVGKYKSKSWSKAAWDHQQQKIDKLVEALEFYANGMNWNHKAKIDIQSDIEIRWYDEDKRYSYIIGGKRARKVLEEIK